MSDLTAKVNEIIINRLGVDESQLTHDAHFINDLSADSLDQLELIMEFEKAFDIVIPDTDSEKITTVGEAITYLDSRVSVES